MEKRIDEILNSMEGCQTASPAPGLFSRIQQKINVGSSDSYWAKVVSFITQPLSIAAAIALFLMINISAFVFNKDKADWATNNTKTVSEKDEYAALGTTNYYNLEP